MINRWKPSDADAISTFDCETFLFNGEGNCSIKGTMVGDQEDQEDPGEECGSR